MKLQTVFYFILLVKFISSLDSVWKWQCIEGTCQKQAITGNEIEQEILSLAQCRIFCSEQAAIWPKITGEINLIHNLTKININSIDIVGTKGDCPISDLIKEAGKVFRKNIEDLLPKNKRLSGGKSFIVEFEVEDKDSRQLTLDTDESYTLTVGLGQDDRVHATIKAKTYFGARHGLETLSQLIVYDNLRGELQVAQNVSIKDKPAYPYRGIVLDTSRNYICIEAIKRTIAGMGASKLNRFHWHITDSHSFPFVSSSRPELSHVGAYAPDKVYTPEDVAEIVHFGLVHGVGVIPEFDAPAHVGEGWQNTGLVVCFNAHPWSQYCVEPPCGQFDPTEDKLYDYLEDIYGDMLKLYQTDIFHMGGDEVHFGCWNSTEKIVAWMAQNGLNRTEEGFIKLWDMFQTRALERLYKKVGKSIPVIMWTSTLTKKEHLHNLDKNKYIVQVWTGKSDAQISNLLAENYRLILSNYDALYFDCGFGAWVTEGNNWCSPYIGWQKVYENTPNSIAGDRKSQILGEEAALWTEQADSYSIDGRLWPRAAAMAEVLWSEPEKLWKEAEQRFLVHRERLVKRGIAADALEPEWCMQNEQNCPINGKFDQKS